MLVTTGWLLSCSGSSDTSSPEPSTQGGSATQAAGGGIAVGGQGTGNAGASAGGNAGANATTSAVGATLGGASSGGASSGTTASGVGGLVGAGGQATGTCGALLDLIDVKSSTTPEGVHAGDRNYRIWSSSSLGVSPVYTAPLANCGTLVCYTTGTSTLTARVARFDASDQLVTTYALGNYTCRGIAAEPDGHFAALLWKSGTAKDCADPAQNGRIYVARYDLAGTPVWTTPKELTNPGTDRNCPTAWDLGESRFEFGNGKYGAYYHVHSASGHEGDTLKYVDLNGTESTTWPWGCSHSMSNLLRYNPADSKFMPACVTDCYPGTSGSDFATSSIGGVYVNNRNKVLSVDAGCDGNVAGELGGAALAPSGWKITFNAHQNPATNGQSSYSTSTMNQDIGLATIAPGLTLSGAVTWLTTTSGVSEADSGIERYQPACDSTEQYLVGWSEPGSAYKYKLARINAAGAYLEGPVDVSAKTKWGRRDDPFRAHVNGDVIWAYFDASGSTTLKLARLRSGAAATCAGF